MSPQAQRWRSFLLAEIDQGAWDGPAAMSACAGSDDPAAAYEAICAGRREGDPALQSSWALPHHSHPGDPPNADGVHAALSRLPQTQGLTNEEAAHSHLEAHMAAIRQAEGTNASLPDVRTLDLADEHVLTVDAAKRILGLQIMPYGVVAEHPQYGRLLFEPGCFGTPDPSAVRLRMDHEDPPTGLGVSFSESSGAARMDFQVSKTPRGDEQLTLAKDGVSRGVSIGYSDGPNRPQTKTIYGKRTTVYGPNSATLAEVSTTWRPTFSEAGVLYALNRQEGNGLVTEPQNPPVIEAGIDYERMAAAIVAANAQNTSNTKLEKALEKFDELIELQRAQIKVPAGPARKPKLYDWVEYTLRKTRGEPMPPTLLKELALDDVVTTEQPGLVPNMLIPDYQDLINQDRPFLQSTRQIAPPATGTSMLLPIITTRAVAGTQAGGQKTVLTTTATKVGTGTFAYQAVFGGADIAIQMIQRAERSFYDLLTGDMGMAYALDAEAKAIAALITGYTDSATNKHLVNSGGAMDPEDPQFGVAWYNSIHACKRPPTHIWMNAYAVGAFIDAKAPITNQPLYSNLAANFTARGGPGGFLSGLTPVYVPAMDASGDIDVIIGPASGFVWAEDPALQLTADQPSLAGRDIALVGGIFPAPRWADAFTVYNVNS
jgi:phage head maturation protease